MKIVVDLEDFYQDEDESLRDSLSRHVTSRVVNEIWERIKSKVDSQITAIVVDKVKNDVDSIIQDRMNELLSAGEIIRHNTTVKISDHVASIFMENSGWNSPHEFIKSRAKEIGAELKSRYDVAFATAIVMNLNQNGMLKEEISKMLLESTPK